MSGFSIRTPMASRPDEPRVVRAGSGNRRVHMTAIAQPTRSKILQLGREADRLTHDRVAMTRLQDEVHSLRTEQAEPGVRLAVNLLTNLVESYLSGPMRNAKVVSPGCDMEAVYAKVAEEATETFLFGCLVGASVLEAGSDDQACTVNLGADACRVGIDGGLGGAGFVNVVLTSSSEKMVTLQAQGPKTDRQVANLIKAATRLAKREGCARVVFVNAATHASDHVLSFGEAVQAKSTDALPLQYHELAWTDGEVPQTPEGRRALVNFADRLSRQVLADDGRTLAVFNCKIGLDRSGVTNALTQAMVDHPDKDPLHAATCVLRNIKRARPHGVSTVYRFRLICACLEDLQSRKVWP